MPSSAMTPIVPPAHHERLWPPQSGQPDGSHYGEQLARQAFGSEEELAKNLAIYGAIGIVAASLMTAGITAATFAAFRKTGSIWMPALVSGLGSLATSGILLYLLVRSATTETDSRMVYMAAGAQLV